MFLSLRGILLLSSSLLVIQQIHAFEVYGFIPWKTHVTKEGKTISDAEETKKYIYQQGFKPVKVVYHKYFLTDDKPDAEKIKKIAEESQNAPNIPISFDIEIGDRYKPETVLPVVQETLRLYREYKGAAPVGVYALLPNDTYNHKLVGKNYQMYLDLNQKYASIAKQVDFLSPVFYNYQKKDIEAWKKTVDFNMVEAKKYAKKYNLKIIPYITSTYHDRKDKFYVEQMTYEEMKQRLTYLKKVGADGVILWESSEGYEISSKGKPVIDFTKGWSKAVYQFKH